MSLTLVSNSIDDRVRVNVCRVCAVQVVSQFQVSVCESEEWLVRMQAFVCGLLPRTWKAGGEESLGPSGGTDVGRARLGKHRVERGCEDWVTCFFWFRKGEVGKAGYIALEKMKKEEESTENASNPHRSFSFTARLFRLLRWECMHCPHIDCVHVPPRL